MYWRMFLSLLALAPLLGLRGQVTVELEFDKDFYIADESMTASVRITNFSGRSLVFGQDNEWLKFLVEQEDGFLAKQKGVAPVVGEFEIPNASRGTRRVNLAPYYKMVLPGRYQVTASVFSQELDEVLQSSPAQVSIIRATTLWQKEFGIAVGEEEEKPSYEIRKYVLIRALNNDRLELYVRVASRDDSKVYGVFPVGNLVAFGSPEAQVDRQSRLHLLQQYGARSFRYLVVTPEGELKIRRRYDYAKSRPRLVRSEQHGIAVLGGIWVRTANDLPPLPDSFKDKGEVPALEGAQDAKEKARD